jgi:phage protein U
MEREKVNFVSTGYSGRKTFQRENEAFHFSSLYIHARTYMKQWLGLVAETVEIPGATFKDFHG